MSRPVVSAATFEKMADSESLPRVIPSNKDDELLLNLGYKPELVRNFSPLQIFGVSFSIMSLVPSITSVLSSSLSGGGAGMTWGWFIPCIFIFSIGLALSELASAMPTAGGLYWWTFKFAPKRVRRCMSFFCGYTDTLGLITSVGSINYGFASQLLSCPALSITSYVPTSAQTYGVFVGACVTQAFVSCLPSQYLSHVQTGTIVLNGAAILLIVIALPVGLKNNGGHLNSAKFVFGNTYSGSDWAYGWNWLLSWMAPIWTISSHDSCIHMAEEASNAAVAVPFGILLSIALCWVGGFLIMCILAAVVSQDLDAVINSSTGNPMAQIIEDCLNTKWAIGLMSLFAVIQWCMGLSCLVATSRQTWAFSRDDCLPFSNWIKKIHKGIPFNAVIFDTVVCCVIGLLILINDTAAEAIFSLSITSLSAAWAMPVLFRAIWFEKDSFVPGPFYMGHLLSRINCWIVVIYSTFVVFVLTMIPTVKSVDATTMNYTCVIVGAVWGGSLIYYFVDAHKWYQGPKLTAELPLDPQVLAGIEANGGKDNALVSLVRKSPSDESGSTPLDEKDY